MKLISKIIITGKIITETGLHIGGSNSALDIGGVDLNVIKTPNGVPYIPGSSIKGKLRSLLARTAGSVAISAKDLDDADKTLKTDQDVPWLIGIFGSSGDDNNKGTVTRLLVRDAYMDTDTFNKTFDKADLDFDYTNVKWENTIDRKKGTALHPRQLERVPAGSIFNLRMVYDVYEEKDKNGVVITNTQDTHIRKIHIAMHLLESDYIGGSGSRGYGKIKFDEVKFLERKITDAGYVKEADAVDIGIVF